MAHFKLFWYFVLSDLVRQGSEKILFLFRYKILTENALQHLGYGKFSLKMFAGYNYLFKFFILHHFFASKIYNKTFNTKV